MATFTPPSENSVPPTLPEGSPGQTDLQYRLFRHFRRRPAGIDVFIYSNGTVSEIEPDSQTTFWSTQDAGYTAGLPYVTAAFYGGHDSYNITAAQSTLLTNAGYTVTP